VAAAARSLMETQAAMFYISRNHLILKKTGLLSKNHNMPTVHKKTNIKYLPNKSYIKKIYTTNY